MKKAVCLLLSILMLVALCACDGGAPSKKSFGVKLDGVEVKIDAKAEPILEALGTYSSYDQSPTCAFEGFDKVYGYGDFEVETYTMDGVEYIRAMHLLSDTCKTAEGVSIGDSEEAVEKAYGDASSKTATALTYEGDGMKLVFLLKDGKVATVQYLKIED